MSGARKWSEVKAAADETRAALGRPVRTEEERADDRDRMLSEARAWQLAEVRRAQSRTQRQLAEAMGVSEPRVTQIEHGQLDNVAVATLRSYVEALGGRLRVIADFDGDAYLVA
jgi:DNA-binding XRE family transcriptional regulator